MSVQFAQRANTDSTGTKTLKKKGQALMKGVEQAENDKGKSKGDAKPVTLSAQPPAQQSQTVTTTATQSTPASATKHAGNKNTANNG
jgi:hypothetical protein